MKRALDLLGRVPAPVWIAIGLVAWAACEDIQHHRCEAGGGRVLTGVVLDGCKEGTP